MRPWNFCVRALNTSVFAKIAELVAQIEYAYNPNITCQGCTDFKTTLF